MARKSGLGSESLYKALRSNSQPSSNTIMRVTNALDAELYSLPKRNRSPARGRGDAPHETIQEPRHIDAQCDLGVFVGVLKP